MFVFYFCYFIVTLMHNDPICDKELLVFLPKWHSLSPTLYTETMGSFQQDMHSTRANIKWHASKWASAWHDFVVERTRPHSQCAATSLPLLQNSTVVDRARGPWNFCCMATCSWFRESLSISRNLADPVTNTSAGSIAGASVGYTKLEVLLHGPCFVGGCGLLPLLGGDPSRFGQALCC